MQAGQVVAAPLTLSRQDQPHRQPRVAVALRFFCSSPEASAYVSETSARALREPGAPLVPPPWPC
eukprot:7199897-Prymnesium_polylepis.1